LTTPRHDPYAALRYPSFALFIAYLWTMTLSTQIQAVVVGWLIYERTRDPLSLGLVGLAEALPFISAALFAGRVADRRDRKSIAMVALLAMTCCSLLLLTFTLFPQNLLDRIWPVYVVIFVSGLARSFLRPAAFAFGAQLIPPELYPSAVAWRSSTWQSAAVIGPALGGFLYAFGGGVMAFAADASLIAVSLGCFVLVRKVVVPFTRKSDDGESLLTGIRFVWRKKELLGAMTLDLFSVLFGGAVALLPIFAAEVLRVGPEGLGMLRAAPAVGSVTMGLVLAHLPPMKRAGRTLLLAVAAFGICMIAFALSRSFMLSLTLLALSGAADNISIVVRSTLLQVGTPQHLLGRVSAVNQVFIGSSNEIGAFESGVAARLMGTVPSVVFGGLMTLLVVALVAWRIPQLRRLERIENVEF
jgi:MFS family permease